MKKLAILLFLVILSTQLVLAADLEVEILGEESVVITEIDRPAKFTLSIKNNEVISESFEIFSLVGVTIFPKEPFLIDAGKTKSLEIEALPHIETKDQIKGFFLFEYQIKGQQTGFFIDRLKIKIVDLIDAIEIESSNISPEDEEIVLTITNLELFTFEDVKIKIESEFFEFSDTLSLEPEEQKQFVIPINKENIKGFSAGEYDMSVTLEIEEKSSKKTIPLKYLEQGGISISTDSSGLVVVKKTQVKTNEGNIESTATITERKDALSRLFTTFSEQPLSSERQGLFVEYLWEKELAPGEQYSITVTTNYTFPFILLILIIIIIIIIKFSLTKDLSLSKKVSFVKTKGGEFALRVKVRVKARKSVKDVEIADRLPGLTKLYEKMSQKPDRIDHHTRQLFWKISTLNAGEERIITYIIYSKINIVGKFELPAARVKYVKEDGKHVHVYSNKAYFMNESSEDKREE